VLALKLAGHDLAYRSVLGRAPAQLLRLNVANGVIAAVDVSEDHVRGQLRHGEPGGGCGSRRLLVVTEHAHGATGGKTSTGCRQVGSSDCGLYDQDI
jgi:hypothetical protein